jgi:hypothetical protein
MPSAAAALLKAMGVGPCKQGSIAGGGIVLVPPAAIAVAGSINIGCEQIQVLTSKIQTFQEVVTCIMNRVAATSDAKVISSKSVELTFAGSLDRSKIHIVQKDDVLVRVVQSLTSDDKSQLSDKMNEFVDVFSKALQDSKTQLISNPQGQKNIQTLSESLSQSDVRTQLNETISKLTFDYVGTDTVKITITGSDGISALNSDIVINQDTILNYQAQQIVTSVLDSIFNTKEGQKVKADIEAQQKSEAKGISEVLGNLGFLAMILIIGALLLFGGGAVITVLKYLIPIAAAVCVGIGVYLGIKHEYVVMGVAFGAAVILAVFEFFSLKKEVPPHK